MNDDVKSEHSQRADEVVEQWLRRRLNSARADLGVNWEEVAQRLEKLGIKTTAGSLMTKHSRASFKAVEYVQILIALGVSKIDLPLDLLMQTKLSSATTSNSGAA